MGGGETHSDSGGRSINTRWKFKIFKNENWDETFDFLEKREWDTSVIVEPRSPSGEKEKSYIICRWWSSSESSPSFLVGTFPSTVTVVLECRALSRRSRLS